MPAEVDTTSDHAFNAMRVVNPGAKWFGLLILAMGLGLFLWMGLPLLRGETITMSVNDGPMQEYGADDPSAWVPGIVGLVFALAGGAIVWYGMRAPRPVTCVAGKLGLSITDAKGNSTTHDWSSFTGEVSRKKRAGQGIVISFGLKSKIHRDDKVRQETVELAGVQDPDVVQAQILARIE